MANPGSKFVSANLNKSYGQQKQQQVNGGGGGYHGQASTAGWGRGGGMVVLSKNRGSIQKTGSKLSVPPPLNLPSLRKEHERFDMSSPSRGIAPGSGAKPSSTRVGWTKPVSVTALSEKNESNAHVPLTDAMEAKDGINGISRGTGSYVPPSARSNGLGLVGSSSGSGSRDFAPSIAKVTVLRGEDFPSLQAARPVSSEASQKQKEFSNQKQKQIVGEELNQNKRDIYHSASLVNEQPIAQPSWNSIRNLSVKNSGEVHGTGRGRLTDQTGKENEYFTSPLPLVHMNPRLDWADDERDTSHRFTERGRDAGYSKSDSYWDGNLDSLRLSILPHKVTQSPYDRWGQRGNETAVFDERDLFSGGLVGVIRKKRDAANATDFHDPVRESFQAELERVQKIQELERQRIIGEQEKALEQARREEEVRQKRIREEEERQLRMEEEAREAAWRAEHERLEAIRIAEEHRIAREEEMRRIYVEEERRKQAAKLKLLELEAKIAKREAQVASAARGNISAPTMVNDEQLEASVKEKDFSTTLDTWEDGERMADKFTTSASFDLFAPSRPYEMSWRPYPPSESSSNFFDAGKGIIRRDAFENGGSYCPPSLEQEIDHYSPRRDAFGGGRAASRAYSYGRARNFMRQPCVLPPPSLNSSQRAPFAHSGPSAVLDDEIRYTNSARSLPIGQTFYNGSNQKGVQLPEVEVTNITPEDQIQNNKSRCDSQSSLSVSSPPNSPPQLSQDELDGFEDSTVKSGIAEVKGNILAESGSVVLNGKSGTGAMDSGFASEDEEWTIEKDDTLQHQEEYDEDEDGFIDDDEVHDGDDENLELSKKFEVLEFEETKPSDMVDNVVLGFDDGVEVVIPSDDFENSSRTQDRTYGIPDISGNVGEKRGLVDGVPAEEQDLVNANDMSDIIANSSSVKIKESELVSEGSIGRSVDASYSSTLDLLDSVDSLVSTGLPVLQSVTSSGDVTTAVGQTSISSVSSAGSPTDLPVKLQFGLFSGPSLIPSPVPAIQIGSIQMPLHIHLPVGKSFTYMDPSQCPVFQFGQMQYTSPISQGILPMPPQSVSFIKPSMQANFNLNQRAGDSMYHQPSPDVSTQNVAEHELNRLPGFVSGPPEQSHGSLFVAINSVLDADSRADQNIGRTTCVSSATDKKTESKSLPQMKEKGHYDSAPNNYLPSSEEKESASQIKLMQRPVQAAPGDKIFSGPRRLDRMNGGRGKNNSYIVRNADTGSSFTTHGMPANSTGFQRRSQRTVRHTEFRIRENIDRGKGAMMVSFKDSGLDDKPSYAGKAMGDFRRSWSKRGTISNRPLKPRTKAEVSDSIYSHVVNPGDMVAKEMGKNVSFKSRNISYPSEANLPKNVSAEVDPPLLKGVVRVYEQPGIEAPSDVDDFIEVRSKRQISNDRREQREKEIKSKSLTMKREKEIKAKSLTMQPPCKLHAPKPNSIVSGGPSKLAMPYENQESYLDVAVSESHQLAHNEVSTVFTTSVFQPLAPIGTPINSEAQIIKPQTGSMTVVSSGEKGCESKNNGTNKIQLSSTSWSTSGINQQVMSLTQTELEEAMKPMRYNSHNSIVGGHSSTANDPILPTMSISVKEKTFSSGASPINSLLAGEKIQFGAVTSPSILPPSSRAVSHGIGAPGSNRHDVQISRNFSVAENGTLFSEKENHSTDGCVPLQDCEAEAASAVAICVDDLVRNGLGPLSAANVPDTKTFTRADIDIITTGVIGGQKLVDQSRGEELLSVSLPADLSVETTQSSLWSPLPISQSSSSQMPSHFSGGPSHLPFYEVNPMLGGPLFAFGPHEESSGTLSQPQKSTAPSSGPLGNWQQWHSGVDSFYNSPAGYPGRLISPSGSIPAVQGAPHMVVYNHFAPVGQYGQFGLSFMGTTFIPSGHTSTSVQVNDGDMHSINTTATQHNTSNMMAPIQHLAPGSPLMPMASPLPMFNLSPFQSAPDTSVKAQWGHIPTSNGSVSSNLPPQVEAELPSQVNNGHSIDHPVNVSMFSESQIQTTLDNTPSFSVATETNITPFSAELRLVDSMRSTGVVTSGQGMVIHSPCADNAESGKAGTPHQDSHGNHNSEHQNASFVNAQILQKNPPIQQVKSVGHSHQRGGISHRNNTGNEWSHRRTGFHGRNHSSGVDRGLPTSKIKRIYVAKTER